MTPEKIIEFLKGGYGRFALGMGEYCGKFVEAYYQEYLNRSYPRMGSAIEEYNSGIHVVYADVGLSINIGKALHTREQFIELYSKLKNLEWRLVENQMPHYPIVNTRCRCGIHVPKSDCDECQGNGWITKEMTQLEAIKFKEGRI